MDPAADTAVAAAVAPAMTSNDEANNNFAVNGSNGHDEDVNGVAPAQAAEETSPPESTYDNLFPSLPMGKPGAAAASANPIGEWNKKPRVATATVTQVFDIPMEERKGAAAAAGGFGGDNSYKMIKNVMDRTGAKIEMSSSKDQSLSFVITGKQDVVLRARRELLREFQVTLSFL